MAAARFWTLVLAWTLALGLAVAGVCAESRHLPVLVTAGIAILVPVAITIGAIALSFAIAGRATRADGMRLTPAESWHALLRELPHFARSWIGMIAETFQSTASSVLTAPMIAVNARQLSRPVLLLPGFACNRAVFPPLCARLRSAGFAPVLAIDLQPLCADLQLHVESAARALRALALQAGGAPVNVVGHSMGGLVARALLRIESQRIGCIVTLGTPHHGTVLARLLSCPGARQLRPGSSWLQALNAEQEGKLPVAVTSIYSREDNIVAPARSALLRGASVLELRGLGHFGLLRAPAALDAIAAALVPARQHESPTS